jgi:hypothetical protein
MGENTAEIVRLWNADHPDDMVIYATEPVAGPF